MKFLPEGTILLLDNERYDLPECVRVSCVSQVIPSSG